MVMRGGGSSQQQAPRAPGRHREDRPSHIHVATLAFLSKQVPSNNLNLSVRGSTTGPCKVPEAEGRTQALFCLAGGSAGFPTCPRHGLFVLLSLEPLGAEGSWEATSHTVCRSRLRVAAALCFLEAGNLERMVGSSGFPQGFPGLHFLLF